MATPLESTENSNTFDFGAMLRNVAYTRVAARVTRDYYQDLRAQGFNEDQALYLVKAAQESIINAVPSLAEHLPAVLKALPELIDKFDERSRP